MPLSSSGRYHFRCSIEGNHSWEISTKVVFFFLEKWIFSSAMLYSRPPILQASSKVYSKKQNFPKNNSVYFFPNGYPFWDILYWGIPLLRSTFFRAFYRIRLFLGKIYSSNPSSDFFSWVLQQKYSLPRCLDIPCKVFCKRGHLSTFLMEKIYLPGSYVERHLPINAFFSRSRSSVEKFCFPWVALLKIKKFDFFLVYGEIFP